MITKQIMKVNAYTGGRNTPSARYRVRQLIPFLSSHNIELKEFISRSGLYPPREKFKRPFWAANNLIENAFKVLNQPEADVTLIQREMFTMHKTFEAFLRAPRVFDVDDAIFLFRGGDFVRRIAGDMQKIICGNSFLADWFSQWNKNIEIIPTSIDLRQYDQTIVDKSKNECVIIWTGSSAGYKFLYTIEKAIKHAIDKNPFARLRVVSDLPPEFKHLRKEQYEFIRWTPQIEVSSIKSSHIGLMPIEDDDWSRGKCSFKMLCYMAAKLPVVVSPYGMNEEVLNMGEIGFGPRTSVEWEDALLSLINSTTLQDQFGMNGYHIIEERFDSKVIAGKLSESLKNI
jgi:glycosyltransferase involved in cell wall biosynthesis